MQVFLAAPGRVPGVKALPPNTRQGASLQGRALEGSAVFPVLVLQLLG